MYESMRYAICGRTVEGLRIWKDGQVFSAECLVQAYRSEDVSVINFDHGDEPFDVRCRKCGLVE